MVNSPLVDGAQFDEHTGMSFWKRSNAAAAPQPTSPEGAQARSATPSVSFEYFAPSAKRVSVAGTFNGWRPDVHPLTKDASGKWSLDLALQPGRYEYKYVVDGSWQNEQRPVEYVGNAFGGANCVVQVK